MPDILMDILFYIWVILGLVMSISILSKLTKDISTYKEDKIKGEIKAREQESANKRVYKMRELQVQLMNSHPNLQPTQLEIIGLLYLYHDQFMESPTIGELHKQIEGITFSALWNRLDILVKKDVITKDEDKRYTLAVELDTKVKDDKQ